LVLIVNMGSENTEGTCAEVGAVTLGAAASVGDFAAADFSFEAGSFNAGSFEFDGTGAGRSIGGTTVAGGTGDKIA
jgi:hypothetical protein